MGTSGQFIDQVRIVTIKLSIFSCEDTAQPVLMSVCQSVCLCVWGHSANFKVPKGYLGLPKGCPRLPKVTQGCPRLLKAACSSMRLQALHELACSYISLNAVKRDCMKIHELACNYISLHAVAQACMQLHKPACSYISLHSVT